MKKISVYTLLLFCAMSCADKFATPTFLTGGPICFEMDEEISVKAPISEISEIRDYVYIHGTLNSNAISSYYENGHLSYNSTTNIWNIGNPSEWSYTAGSENRYSFYAYAYNTDGGGLMSGNLTTGNSVGKNLTITQPATYNHNGGKGCGVDYLLSQDFQFVTTVKDDGQIQVSTVKLHMEHAMAYVEVALAVSSKLYSVNVTNVSISNIYKKADMQCTSHAIYGNKDGKTNIWRASALANIGTYTNNLTFSPATDGAQQVLLRFCAIPQMMTTSVLTLEMQYRQAEGGDWETVTNSWNLNNYANWESGYKNRYVIDMDTSNKLIFTTESWKEIGVVQGTILPGV